MQHRYLLDGSNYIFRAYYALDELSGPDGNNANAVYGFFRMVLNLLIEQPDYVLIARDTGKATKRKEAYTDYKANRSSAPDDLKHQIHQIHDLVDELRIPYSSAVGYEADDVLYTYSHLVDSPHLLTTIYTADKDMKQLINDTTHIADPMKRETRDHTSFVDHRGFVPPLIVDYLALIGDTSDNIPGVPGIGPKSASALITTHGSIEQIYAALDDGTLQARPSVSAKLTAGRDSAHLSKDLITLLPLPEPASYMSLSDMAYEPDYDHRRRVFVDHRGFHSFDKKITQRKTTATQSVQGSLF